GCHGEARQGVFADNEVLGGKWAEEDFLRIELHEHRIDAVDLDGAVDQRPVAVVVTDRDGEIEFGHLLSLCGWASVAVRKFAALSACSEANFRTKATLA